MDLTGPKMVVSANGNSFIINIVDDFSNFPWSFVLQCKFDALPILQSWALQAECESSEHICVIWTDNGELRSHNMDSWCASNGY